MFFSSPGVSDTLWSLGGAANQASPSLTISQSFPKFMFIALVMPLSHLILWCPLPLLASVLPNIWDFPNESAVHIRWTKHWSFSFSISPSNNIQGWFSMRLTGFISLPSKGLSGVFSSTIVPRHQFFSALLYGPAPTVFSGFGVQEEEICHYLHLFPFDLPWSGGVGWLDLSEWKLFSCVWLFATPLTI